MSEYPNDRLDSMRCALAVSVGLCGMGVVDGVLSGNLVEAPWWQLLFVALGVVSPLAILGALVGLSAQRGWHTIHPTLKSPQAALSALGCAAVALGVSALIGPQVTASIRTEWMAAVVQGGLSLLLLCVIGLVVGPWLHRLLECILARIGALHPRLHTPTHNTSSSFAVLCAVLYVFVTMGMAWKWNMVQSTPWWIVPSSAIGLILVAVVSRVSRHATRTRLNVAMGVWLTALGGAGGLVYGGAPPDSIFSAFDQPGITQAAINTTRAFTDMDNDGTSSWLGGGDCDSSDSAIHPNATDVPDDGIDQDCSGTDARLRQSDYNRGTHRHTLPSHAPTKPHIIVISTDALSFKHTSLGGYHRPVTPNLDAWAKRATVFPTTYAASTATRFSIPSLFTGLYNAELLMDKAKRWPYPWNKANVTLAEMLKKKGWRTIHVVPDSYFGTRWKGLHQGVDLVDQSPLRKPKVKHSGARVTESIIKHIQAHQKNHPSKPLYMWAHYFDHHGPYVTPKGTAKSFGSKPIDRYDDELRATDVHWGRVFKAIEAQWKPEEYILIFTSDHGERFDAKPRHGGGLGPSMIHVPWIVQTHARRGEQVEGMTGHLDLVPTIANLLGLTPNPQWSGESLVNALWTPNASPEKTLMYGLSYRPEKKAPFYNLSVRTKTHYAERIIKTGQLKVYTYDASSPEVKMSRKDTTYKSIKQEVSDLLQEELTRLKANELGLPHRRNKQKNTKKSKR